jgi:hypothetical protein
VNCHAFGKLHHSLFNEEAQLAPRPAAPATPQHFNDPSSAPAPTPYPSPALPPAHSPCF